MQIARFGAVRDSTRREPAAIPNEADLARRARPAIVTQRDWYYRAWTNRADSVRFLWADPRSWLAAQIVSLWVPPTSVITANGHDPRQGR
jgi:hypothetical protein